MTLDGSYQCHSLSRIGQEGDVLENLPLRSVVEGDVIEFDLPLCCQEWDGVRDVFYFLLFVHQVKHVLHVDEALLNHAEKERKLKFSNQYPNKITKGPPALKPFQF